MTKQQLYDYIDNLTGDYEFEYEGKHGVICPFARDNIAMYYDGNSAECKSVQESMSVKIFNGHSANEVCDRFVDL